MHACVHKTKQGKDFVYTLSLLYFMHTCILLVTWSRILGEFPPPPHEPPLHPSSSSACLTKQGEHYRADQLQHQSCPWLGSRPDSRFWTPPQQDWSLSEQWTCRKSLSLSTVPRPWHWRLFRVAPSKHLTRDTSLQRPSQQLPGSQQELT